MPLKYPTASPFILQLLSPIRLKHPFFVIFCPKLFFHFSNKANQKQVKFGRSIIRQPSLFCFPPHPVADLLPSVALSPAPVTSLSPGGAASLGASGVPHAPRLLFLLPAGVAGGGYRALALRPAILHRLGTCREERRQLVTSSPHKGAKRIHRSSGS